MLTSRCSRHPALIFDRLGFLQSTTCSCKSLQVEFLAKTAEIPSTFQRHFLKWEYRSSPTPELDGRMRIDPLCPSQTGGQKQCSLCKVKPREPARIEKATADRR